MKPYLIVLLRDGELGKIYERPDMASAVEQAMKVALEQDPNLDQSVTREVLDTDGILHCPSFTVALAMTEDD